MAGTYILTDTINHSFAEIFQTANQGKVGGRQPHGDARRGGTARSLADRRSDGQGVPRRRRRQASGVMFVRGRLLDVRAKAHHRGAPAFIASVEPKPFNAFAPVKGGFPTRAPGRRRRSDREPGELKLGEQHRRCGHRRRRSSTRSSASCTTPAAQSFGGAGVGAVDGDGGTASRGQVGHFDQIDVAATAGVTPKELRDRIKALLPARSRCGQGPNRRATRLGPRRKPRLPADVPVDLRLRRAARGRFHHLQHVLDHRRAADPRVWPAAHARRLARTGDALGDLGRPVPRHSRRPAWPARRNPARPGTRRAVQSGRRRPAQQRHGARDAHDRRLTGSRHRDHVDRRTGPGDPLNEHLAACGDARGLRRERGAQTRLEGREPRSAFSRCWSSSPRSSTAGCRAQSSEPWSRSSPRAGCWIARGHKPSYRITRGLAHIIGAPARGAGSPAAWRWRTRSVSPAARSRQPRR